MAKLEIGPLSDRLSDEEIHDLAAQLEKLGAPPIPPSDESNVGGVGEGMDPHAFGEFVDRLDGHDIAAEIYLPIEFDGTVEVAGLRVGSVQTLLEALEEIRDELDIDDDEDDDYDDDDEPEDEDDEARSEEEIEEVWYTFQAGAEAAVERQLPLLVRG